MRLDMIVWRGTREPESGILLQFTLTAGELRERRPCSQPQPQHWILDLDCFCSGFCREFSPQKVVLDNLESFCGREREKERLSKRDWSKSCCICLSSKRSWCGVARGTAPCLASCQHLLSHISLTAGIHHTSQPSQYICHLNKFKQ